MISLLPGLRTIISSIFKSAKLMMEVLLLMLFVLLVITLFGIQIFKGVLKHKCVRNLDPDVNVTYEQWRSFVQNKSNWLVQDDIDINVCGNASSTGRCPANYTCLSDVGLNPNSGFTSYDHFGWGFVTSFQLLTLDRWENCYNLILRSSGLYYVFFFTVIVMFASYYVVNLVLAVVASSYEKEFKRKEKVKKEQDEILELRRRKEKMKKKNTLNPKERFRQYGRQMTRGFSMESVLTWATELSHYSADDEEQTEKNPTFLESLKTRLNEKLCSWTCCAPYLKMQEVLKKIMTHSFCEGCIIFCIFLNTILLAIDYYKAPYSNILNQGNTILTAIFAIEAFLKILAFNLLPYLNNGWNAFDFIIVLLSFVDWGLTAANFKSFDISVIRSFRMLRVFKLAKSWKTLNVLITVIFASLKEMGNLTVIVVIVIYIFAVIGMQLVGKDYLNKAAFPDNQVPRWNFLSFYKSFLMVFRVICGEWVEPLYDCMRCSRIYFCIPLFFATYIIGNFLVLNLFLALLLNFFSGDTLTAKESNNSPPLSTHIKRLLTVIKLKKFSKHHSAKIQPNETVEGSNVKLSQLLQLQSGTSPNAKSQEEQNTSTGITCVDQNPKAQVASVPSQNEIPTVSAHCRRYENGSAVIVPETLEEAHIEPEIEIVHSAIGKGPINTGKKSPENAKQEHNVTQEQGNQKQEKEDTRKMKPCCPSICSKMCSCFSSSTDAAAGQIFNSLRSMVYKLVNNTIFDGIVLFVILVSTVTLALDDKYTHNNAKIQEILQYLDYFYTAFFNLEMLLKLIGLGAIDYFTNIWTLLDFLLVNGWLSLLSNNIKAFSSLRSLRTLRALRPLRAISRWEGMRLVVNALIRSIPSISNVMLVCLVFWLIFGIVGVQIYGGKFYQCVDRNGQRLSVDIVNNITDCQAYSDKGFKWVNTEINFDNIMSAYLALLQVSTFEGWMEIMASAADARGIDLQPQTDANMYSLLYFVAFIIVGTFFTLNLFIGVIIDNFNTVHKKSRKEGALVMLLTEDQRYLYDALKRLSKVKPIKQIPPPTNIFFLFFYKVVNHRYFEPATIILIVSNMLFMTSDHYEQTEAYSNVQNVINILFTALFSIEAVLKILGLRLYYFTQAWNIFDILVIITSIIGNLLDSVATQIGFSPTMLRVLRLARLGRLLRLVRSLKGIRRLIFTLIISIPALFNIGILLFLVMFIYSILGMNLFRDLPRNGSINEIVNFETFANSMLLLFRLTTAAGWNDVLQQLLVSNVQPNIVCILFMSSYILISFIVIVNMYVAVILENFNQAQEQEMAGVTDDDIDMFYEVWSKYDPFATQFILYEQLSDFLDDLKPPMRIPKPNAVKLAALNLPVTNGNKLHCLDILRAMCCVIVGNVKETDPLKELQGKIVDRMKKRFPIRNTMQTVTTTLMIRKEVKAAMTIQKAFRRWRKRQRLKMANMRAEKKSVHSVHSSSTSSSSSRPSSPDDVSL
ncbi:sodium channel protein type 1 subunit alpha-like [Polypterus senegalus]|uniref:sodium channel protein type 1 subunit alpha-like n=1 Tax=Polypterus senegalus TaxID=55291 RepID=UPI00196451BD|nr:sodium channel protein type 1 subunit alpha-like [Polypterus senegalus]